MYGTRSNRFLTDMKTRFFSCLLLCGALALTACPTTNPKKPAKKPAATEKHEAAADDGSVDFQAFLGRLRQAVKAHDVNTLAGMMTPDFGYRLEPVGAGDGVFKFWDDNNLWPELDAVVSENFQSKDAYMVAPPQFADPAAQYEGYRAGIRRVNGSWKFAYFVNG